MGFYATDTLPAKADPRSKNRVMESRRSAATRARLPASEPVETVSETSVTVTITASGLVCWISRDPIGEIGGLNLYGFCGNRPGDRVDVLGCKFEWVPIFGQIEQLFKTKLKEYQGMKSVDYASCADEDVEICKLKIATKNETYKMGFVAPNAVKLLVEYGITIVAAYIKSPAAIPAAIVTGLDTAATLVVAAEAGSAFDAAAKDAEKQYCGCVPTAKTKPTKVQ
jgi:hypothetical protein